MAFGMIQDNGLIMKLGMIKNRILMKKLIALFILIASIIACYGQYEAIQAGQSGNTVRTNMNRMFNELYGNSLTYNFSSDGESWHPVYANTDNYMRLSSDLGVTWSDAILLKDVAFQYSEDIWGPWSTAYKQDTTHYFARRVVCANHTHFRCRI